MSAERDIRAVPGARRVEEADRLATIARLGMTETATVATFDALVHALRLMLDVAAAYVVVIDVDSLKVWSGVGEGTLWSVPRQGSFSEEVVRTGRSLVVTDARRDPRFADHFYVTRPEAPMPFFVGIPLATSTGAVLGTLCGFDAVARPAPDEATVAMLEELATTAVAELELKTANAELEAQEIALVNRSEILEATFDNITEGVTIFDGNLDLVAVNRKGAEILGLSAEVHDDPTTLDLTAVARAGFYGQGDPAELLASRAGRLRQYLDTRPQPLAPDTEITLADGRTVRRRLRQMSEGFITTYVDMSDLRRRQAELLVQARYFELQHKLAVLSNSAPDLGAALRRVVDLNRRELDGALGTVWRRAEHGLTQMGILSLGSRPELGGAAEAALAATLLRPSPLALRCAAQCAIAYATEADTDRGDAGALCAAEDMRTGYAIPLRVLDDLYVLEFYGRRGFKRKSWHKDIVKDVETQLALVAERDRARLRKAEFISTISHELRTPLTSMRGMLELLESGLFGALPEDAAALLGKAGADSRVLGTLIEDVLAIHDIQHGDTRSAPEPGDLAPFLSEAARAAGLVLALDEGAAFPAVFDQALLGRAFAKLAGAFDGPAGPARVSVRHRSAGIRIVVEGPARSGPERCVVGHVAIRLACCLLERAGGRVVDRSSSGTTTITVDLPTETVRARAPGPAASVAFSHEAAFPVAMPAPGAFSSDRAGGPLLQALGA